MRLAKLVVTWVLQAIGGVIFVLLGTGKFMDPDWARRFAGWGYPDGFYMVVGALEAIGGLAVLVPRFASYGAALLVVIMAGAAVTHAVHGETQRVMVPVVYAILLAVVGWLRRGSALRPNRRPLTAGSQPVV